METNYTITKLDKRHKGQEHFKYYVTPFFRGYGLHQYQLELFKWRTWAWEAYGPGMERDFAHLVEGYKWGWYTEYGRLRLYLKGDEELVLFKLSF